MQEDREKEHRDGVLVARDSESMEIGKQRMFICGGNYWLTWFARFIPNRDGQDLQASYSLLHDDGSPATPSRSKKKTPHGELHFQRTEEANRTYSKVLRNELMGDSVPQDFRSISPDDLFGRRQTPPGQPSISAMPPASITPTTPHKNMFSYKSPQKVIGSGHPTPSSRTGNIWD